MASLTTTVQIKMAAKREIKDSLMTGGGAVASKILEMNTQGGGKPPKILYCSRTHSQIQQVVQEIKKTKYKNTAYDFNTPVQCSTCSSAQACHSGVADAVCSGIPGHGSKPACGLPYVRAIAHWHSMQAIQCNVCLSGCERYCVLELPFRVQVHSVRFPSTAVCQSSG